jgi:hypothetical protein
MKINMNIKWIELGGIGNKWINMDDGISIDVISPLTLKLLFLLWTFWAIQY